MQITRSSGTETALGPKEWFAGTVYVDTVAAPSGSSRLGAASVHFTPGARTAWHAHPLGQTVFVTGGVGLCGRRGGPAEAIRPGDRVFFEPGEDHWRGAAPDRFMSHLAVREADEGTARWPGASTSPTRRTAPRQHHKPQRDGATRPQSDGQDS